MKWQVSFGNLACLMFTSILLICFLLTLKFSHYSLDVPWVLEVPSYQYLLSFLDHHADLCDHAGLLLSVDQRRQVGLEDPEVLEDLSLPGNIIIIFIIIIMNHVFAQTHRGQ